MHSLARLSQLPPPKRLLLIHAFAVLGAIRLGLWILPFRWLRRSLQVWPKPLHAPRPSASAESIIWAVTVAGAYVPAATCLAQALAAQALLRRHRHGSTLRIGVAAGHGRLEAHAWLEHDGRIILGKLADLERYTLLPALERPDR